MDNRLLAEGLLLGMSSFGMEIDKWDGDIMYISVPKDTTDINQLGEALAGKKPADRIQTKMRDLGAKDLRIECRIRDEIWAKEKREQILK